jgi:hypothetical protein
MSYASWRFDPTIGLPGNSQYTILYDSTENFTASAYAPTAALKAPGSLRGMMRGLRIAGSVKPVTQGITLRFYILTGDAGTNADWELDTTASGTGGTGAISVAAGTAQTFSWAPALPDCAVVILAGATAPSDIDAYAQLIVAARS